MIDKITITKQNLTECEINKIVALARLEKKISNRGFTFDNQDTKNFNGMIFVKIDLRKDLIIKGSLHKYASFLNTKVPSNFDRFTMQQANDTFIKLFQNIGFDPVGAIVTGYEVGLNLNLDIDIKKVLEKVHSIDRQRIFYIDPRYKDGRQITTLRTYDNTIAFVMYDKIFQMKKDRLTPPKVDYNILRIETIHRRQKIKATDFIKFENLNNLKKLFIKEWDSLIMYTDFEHIKPISSNTLTLIKKLVYDGTNTTKEGLKSQLDNKTISYRKYKYAVDFIDAWYEKKHEYKPIKSKVSISFLESYNTENQLIK